MAIRESRSQKSSLDPAWRTLKVSDQERERRKSLDMSILVLSKKEKRKNAKKEQKKRSFSPGIPQLQNPLFSFPYLFSLVCRSEDPFVYFSPFLRVVLGASGGNCFAKNRLALTRERYPDVHIIDELLGESPVLLISQGELKRCLGFSLYVYHSRNRK